METKDLFSCIQWLRWYVMKVLEKLSYDDERA
jgi:hypothetical protein